MKRAIFYLGLALVIIGVVSADSESLVTPMVFIAIGSILMTTTKEVIR